MKKLFAIAAIAVLGFVACNKTDDDGPKDELTGVAAAKGNVVLNECCGVKTPGKFVEFYNLTDKDVDMSDCKIYKGAEKNDAGEKEFVAWVGPKGLIIPAHGFLALDADGEASDEAGRVPVNADVYKTNFMTGFSPKKSVQFRLVDAKGNEIDKFSRGPVDENGFWGVALNETKDASYSRVPDGTGDWVLAVPTKGVKNGEKTGDIVTEVSVK